MVVKDNSYGVAPVQDKMLEILKYFIALCEANDLRYWAGGGTCIGALRHSGFIPWDEDLDVFMPRPDYERLWANFDRWKTCDKYALCRTTKEKNYHHRVMQLADLETTFINKRSVNEDIEHGVYIDIMPMDIVPGSPVKRLFQIADAIIFSVYNIQCKPEYHEKALVRALVGLMLSAVRDPEKRVAIWQRAERRMIVKTWDETARLVELTTNVKALLHPYPHDWFGNGERKVRFEDIEISVPTQAEKYLTSFFGDFMQLPPEEKRHYVHNTVLIDLNNSYVNYKGKYYCCDQNKGESKD